ncbi:hypothetical protein [Streptosporangium sp. KLBMP 9127]|nr:hypothetical protein [Streptosporangium sp. KLBMP 9127]
MQKTGLRLLALSFVVAGITAALPVTAANAELRCSALSDKAHTYYKVSCDDLWKPIRNYRAWVKCGSTTYWGELATNWHNVSTARCPSGKTYSSRGWSWA